MRNTTMRPTAMIDGKSRLAVGLALCALLEFVDLQEPGRRDWEMVVGACPETYVSSGSQGSE